MKRTNSRKKTRAGRLRREKTRAVKLRDRPERVSSRLQGVEFLWGGRIRVAPSAGPDAKGDASEEKRWPSELKAAWKRKLDRNGRGGEKKHLQTKKQGTRMDHGICSTREKGTMSAARRGLEPCKGGEVGIKGRNFIEAHHTSWRRGGKGTLKGEPEALKRLVLAYRRGIREKNDFTTI